MRGQRHEGGSEEGGPDGVFRLQHVLDVFPNAPVRAQTMVPDLQIMRPLQHGFGSRPSAGNVTQQIV